MKISCTRYCKLFNLVRGLALVILCCLGDYNAKGGSPVVSCRVGHDSSSTKRWHGFPAPSAAVRVPVNSLSLLEVIGFYFQSVCPSKAGERVHSMSRCSQALEPFHRTLGYINIIAGLHDGTTCPAARHLNLHNVLLILDKTNPNISIFRIDSSRTCSTTVDFIPHIYPVA